MKNSNTFKYSFILLMLLPLINGCSSDSKKENTSGSAPIHIEIGTIKNNTTRSTLHASGKVEAVKSANLSTRVMGFVDRIPVQIGDKVKKGAVLVKVNSADLSARLAQVNAQIAEAEAAYLIAEKDYGRYKSLFNSNSATMKELDDVTANYNMAKARLEAAREMKTEVNAQMSYINLRAPFSGVVTNKFIKEGDMAKPGVPLVEVESPGRYQVLAMVPESEINNINTTEKVKVQLKTLGAEIRGVVSEVSTSSKNTGGQFLVKILLDQTDHDVLSGMYATVLFPLKRSPDQSQIMIPSMAIVEQGQLKGVYTLSKDNKALLRWLRLGRSYGDSVEVLSGLTTDENFILSADGKLYNGVAVTVE